MSIEKISRTARFGQFAANFGLVIYALTIVTLIGDFVQGEGALGKTLLEGTPWETIASPMPTGIALACLPLWFFTFALGAVLLWHARALFLGVRRQGVFVDQTAKRLTIIGWIVVALAPADILSTTAISWVVRALNPDKGIQLIFAVDDGDIYAVVVGLVIVVLGRIMTEAIRLYRENGEFV